MKLKLLLLFAALFLIASPAFAQQPANPASWAIPIGASIGMAIASGLCGLAQGRAVGQAAEGLARNPSAAGPIRFALILGLVLIESLALYTLVIILLKAVAV